MEIWKTIEKYPDYAISNKGRLKRIKISSKFCPAAKIGRILKLNSGKHWKYICYPFWNKKTKKSELKHIHKLVLETFIGYKSGFIGNHKNGNKIDNRLENLEWVTRSEDTKHAHRIGLIKHKIGGTNCKLKIKDICLIKRLLCKRSIKIDYIAKMFQVNQQTIYNIRNHKSWKEIK